MNFENLTIRDFKVNYFIFPLFLVPKLRSVAQNEWKKHPYIYFFFLLLVQKKMSLSGQNWKKNKNSKNLKVPNLIHTSFSIFLHEKSK